MNATLTVPALGDAPRLPSHWLVAGAVALAMHGTVIAAWLYTRDVTYPAAGAPAVLLELAPVAVAPQASAAQESSQVQESQKDAERPPPEVDRAVQPDPESMVTQETPLPEPVPVPSRPSPVVIPQAAPKKPAVAKPADKPAIKPAEKRRAEQRQASAPSAAVASPSAAAPQIGVSSDVARAAAAQWRDLVVAHLQRHKRYPEASEARREEGVVRLAFAVDRNGRVLSHRIAGSSGHAELDREISSMIVRAQPLPAFLPGMTQARENLIVPLRFTHR